MLIPSPATGVLALIAIGTPANGRSSPGSISSAAASARSASTSMNALTRSSSASIRSSANVTTSRAAISPPRTNAASSGTGLSIRLALIAGGGSLRDFAARRATGRWLYALDQHDVGVRGAAAQLAQRGVVLALVPLARGGGGRE